MFVRVDEDSRKKVKERDSSRDSRDHLKRKKSSRNGALKETKKTKSKRGAKVRLSLRGGKESTVLRKWSQKTQTE